MFTISEIIEATGGRLVWGKLNNKVSGIAIDSRTIKPKELFVAIVGQRFDGHNFIAQAKCRGARAALFSNLRYKKCLAHLRQLDSWSMIQVPDTIYALGQLARCYRERFKIPVIAITGSNGKTTTKEMLSSILSIRSDTLRSPGTENNLIGVPLTLFKLRTRHKLAVIEIGANHPGEIERLSGIVKPTAGIITNIGPAHLEFFKSLKGVFKTKLELLKNLASNGKIIINQDDRFLSQLKAGNCQKITFGFNRLSNFCGQIIEQTKENTIFLLNKRQRIALKAPGRHNVYNALASIACARSLGLGYSDIKIALASFRTPQMRTQSLDVDGVRIINDCYNSNPKSLQCALEFLKVCSGPGKKITVLGDMLELGREAKKLHLNSGKMLARIGIDSLITVGNLARYIASGAQSAGMPPDSIYICRNTTEASRLLCAFAHPKDVILIKGSRAMTMEDIVKCFTSSFIR